MENQEPMVCPRRIESGITANSPFKVPEHDTWREDGTCSWCGSLNPDEFMKRVFEGKEITPTDKSYKVYTKEPWGKFYFQHLRPEQRTEFIQMLNERRVVLSYPHHFYVLPFFIVAK